MTIDITNPRTGKIGPVVSHDVTFGYETGRPIVRHISMQLEPGRLCVLIGPNATGKSTLLRLLVGQHTPWSGSVTLADRRVDRMAPSQRAQRISYVPQRSAVHLAFTVRQVVEMGRHTLPPHPHAVDQALETCDLMPLGDYVYAKLSVGQQQRVLVARAMAQAAGQGRVMLLDEPASAMDPYHLHQVMGLLVGMARSGMAVLVVLHDLNVAVRYADTACLMDQGQIVASGPWHSVLRPGVLEPVYRVRIQTVSDPRHDRPVFRIEPDPSQTTCDPIP